MNWYMVQMKLGYSQELAQLSGRLDLQEQKYNISNKVEPEKISLSYPLSVQMALL